MDFIYIRQGDVNIQKSINMTHYINRFKGGKNPGSIRCRKKPLDKNLTTFQDGTLNKLQTINLPTSTYKCHYEKSIAMGKE